VADWPEQRRSTFDWLNIMDFGRLPYALLEVVSVKRIRRDQMDAVILFSMAVVAFVLSDYYDIPRHIFQFGMAHENWKIDDLIFVSFLLGIAWMVYGFRRYQDVSREIKARIRAELEARDLARHDPLTGLPNRRFFAEKLDEYLRGTSDTQQLAVLMLDLDGFKRVNDMHGHATGDKALSEFARRAAALLRAGSVFARIGGDEFAIIMSRINSLDDPTNLARRIAASVAEPLMIDNLAVELGVGVGIAIAPNDGSEPDKLVRRADRALYRAKEAGRSSVRFFEPEMDTHVERRIQIERDLRSAIASSAIVPHYQPLVSLDGDRIIGFEALARWESEASGYIPPDVFIPIAEETGLINVLGDQLFRRACLDANAWPAHFILAFNISPIQLRDPTIGLRILSILGQTEFSPRRLEIEITESALVENVEVVQTVIGDLRRAGVRIALDDFGTGYATLSQLLSFRLDKIKIDRSFVSHLDKSDESLVIVRAILGLAKGLGLTTTAEGVEDTGELACLKANGCAQGQGYLFSKAIPAAAIPALLGSPLRDTAAA
jgi:diguanylate cyclase (GGDEF)-like protein